MMRQGGTTVRGVSPCRQSSTGRSTIAHTESTANELPEACGAVAPPARATTGLVADY